MWQLEKKYSPHQFSIFRILLGFYLIVYFIRLIPFGTELFSSNGMVENVLMNWTSGVLPIIVYLTHPVFITCLLSIMVILSISLVLGLFRRTSAILLWIGWMLLLNMNNFTGDPSLPFVGLLLLSLAVIPTGEPFSFSNKIFKVKNPKAWFMPSILYWGIWIVFGISFTLSGVEKLMSPAWYGGTAALLLYQGPFAFHNIFTDILRNLSLWFNKFTTWIILYSQLLGLPSLFFNRTRLLFWSITTVLFVFSLLLLKLTDVLIAMLLFYFFIMDSTWFQKKHKKYSVFLDNTCSLCNGFGKFISDEDLNHRYKIESFQGEAIKRILTEKEIVDIKAMVLVDNRNIYRGADAFIHSVANLGGIWISAKILFLFPRKIRDTLYQYISTRRHGITVPH